MRIQTYTSITTSTSAYTTTTTSYNPTWEKLLREQLRLEKLSKDRDKKINQLIEDTEIIEG